MKTSIKGLLTSFLLMMVIPLYALPTAKLTVRVIDEEGTPIQGAKMSCVFESPKKNAAGVETKLEQGISDVNGLFSAKGSTNEYGLGCSARKKGYYDGGGWTGRFTGVSGIIGFRKWQPWNPTVDAVLKKIKNPIPMYVARIRGKVSSDDPPAKLPEAGKFFGFDLIAKDWIVPHGQGLHSDFIFKVDVAHDRGVDDYDATMVLKFPNPDDGIQSIMAEATTGNRLRLSHHAPLTGYQDKLAIRDLSEKGKVYNSPRKKGQNYFFRIRTKRDEQGNIIEAHYGKIHGNIIFSLPSKKEKAELYFSYYLNPNNNDTNIEFAPEKNLFPKPDGHRGRYWFNP